MKNNLKKSKPHRRLSRDREVIEKFYTNPTIVYLVDKMATKKTISNTTLNKWNEDDDGKIWRVVERQIKLDKIDIDSWTAAVDQIGVKIKILSNRYL